MSGLQEISVQQNAIQSKLDIILSELSNNGGKTVKDLVNSVKDAVVRVESRQQAILDSSDTSHGMFEVDIDGNIRWVNKKLCYILSKTVNDLTGRGWYNFVTSEQKQYVIAEFQDCIEQSREFILEFDMIIERNKSKRVQWHTTKMLNPQGAIMGYFGNVIEVK